MVSSPTSPGKRRRGARPAQDEVQRITSAPEPLAEDLARRQRRYLAQMGIRLLCFAGAFFTWGHLPVAVPILLLVAAVVLPYVAVLLANAGRERRDEDTTFMTYRELGPGSGPHDQLGGRP